MERTYERTIGGRPLIIQTGKLAGQANGAITIRYGDTLALVTACASDQPREGIDFFPLTVDYEERLYAAGKIPGSFFRREGRPTTEAILTARLTDRPIRPLFPKGFRNDVQVVITVLSADQENDPSVLAIAGASTALAISDIPFTGPVSGVRIGYINGEYVVNPTFAELKESQLELVVASTRDAIIMVEAGANEVSEELMLGALRFGHEANQELIALQDEIVAAEGKPKMPAVLKKVEEEVRQAVANFVEGKMGEILSSTVKEEREEAIGERREEIVERLGDQFSVDQLMMAFDDSLKYHVRSGILNEGRRPDGRGPAEIRPISSEVGLLPRAHGSGFFTRGQTQVLSVATLGSSGDEQRLDTLSPEDTKRFLHHYNFPGFSNGEVRRIGSPGRREIGHGALAERALEPVIPGVEDFPYTIRIVSEVLSSNGSTSMASVCGSTLALMDAGVPIKTPVAGVAMGLMMGEGGNYAILTDIAGVEDALGDMDFKVAGTSDGITALQMDMKITGISLDIMEKALAQAHEGRMFILGRMRETIAETRPELSRFAPRMYRIQVPQDKIGTVIGPGGRMIRSIIEETKSSVDIEDDGTIFIGSSNEENAKRAIQIIQGLTKDVELGEIYTGQVTRLASFGAFVEILPGKEGLVRLPDLADYQVNRPEDVVRVGDEVMVMVVEVDNLGRINLSRRAVLEGATVPPPPSSSGGGPPPQRQRGGSQMQGGRRPPQRNNGRPGQRPQGRNGEQGNRGGGRDFQRRPEGEGTSQSPPPPPPPPLPPFGGRR